VKGDFTWGLVVGEDGEALFRGKNRAAGIVRKSSPNIEAIPSSAMQGDFHNKTARLLEGNHDNAKGGLPLLDASQERGDIHRSPLSILGGKIF